MERKNAAADFGEAWADGAITDRSSLESNSYRSRVQVRKELIISSNVGAQLVMTGRLLQAPACALVRYCRRSLSA